MDYFNQFGFIKEPFSSAQVPEFLFQSKQYVNTLEKIKDSIVNRHGMIVVLGEEGAGKTMLCQDLVAELEKNDTTEVLLIRGSAIGSDLDFTGNISKLFGKYIPSGDIADPHSKENIKEHIFKKCVSEKKTGAIIIDDGHMLPDSCLQFLEECFKYHIDAHKLLQVVIFGRTKIKKDIRAFKDLSTWVHSYITMDPLNFNDTKELISLRLSMASDANVSLSLFSFPALWSIFRTSNGYPGRIVDFCQVLLMTMAIHHYSKADWYLAQHCSKMIYPEQTKKIQKKRFGMLSGAMAAIIIYSFTMNQADIIKLPQNLNQKQPAITKTQTPPPTPVAPEKQQPAVTKTQAPLPTSAASEKQQSNSKPVPPKKIVKQTPETAIKHPVKRTAATAPSSSQPADVEKVLPTPGVGIEKKVTVPDKKKVVGTNPEKIAKTAIPTTTLPVKAVAPVVHKPQKIPSIAKTEPGKAKMYGEVTVRNNETLGDMISTIYGAGSFTKLNTAAIMKDNPHIDHPSLIAIGDTVRFPATQMNSTPKTDKTWWVQLASFDQLDAAYSFLRGRAGQTLATRIIAVSDDSGVKKFSILLEDTFAAENEAQKAKKKVSSIIFPEALVLASLDNPAYQYNMPKIAVQPGASQQPVEKKKIAIPPVDKVTAPNLIAANPEIETAKQLEASTSKSHPLRTAKESQISSNAVVKNDKKSKAAARPILPHALGKITVMRGENLGDMIRKTYGPYSFNPKNTAIVLKNNPHIKNPGRISVGTTIQFPVIPVSLTPDAAKVWWLQYALVERLDEAYRFLRRYFVNTAPMLIIPTWNNQGELQFSILKQEYFRNADAAHNNLSSLSQKTFPDARLIHGLKNHQFYYKLKAKEADRF